MCEICRQNPCHPRCPNAPEPTPVYECEWCKEPILDGEEYLDTPDGPVCKECIEGMIVTEYMELVGETFSTAERKDY